MSDYNWNEIYDLLLIVEKAKDLPNLKKIRDTAIARLEEIANPSNDEPQYEDKSGESEAANEAALKHQEGQSTEPKSGRRA